MPKSLDESQIGRRLRLRDLHLFFAVVQRGGMAKAAAQLGIAQPAVSKVIADLESTLGVRLFDRTTQGVEPTIFGQALLRRGLAAFDELKQGIRDIAFLSDPTGGEVRIGCGQAACAAILPPIIRGFCEVYPNVVFHVTELPPPRRDLTGLRERKYDLVLGHLVMPSPHESLGDDLNVESLFHDPLVVAVGMQNKWARRRKIDLAELVDAHWILPDPITDSYSMAEQAFRARGLVSPKVRLVTSSIAVRADLLANDTYISIFPRSLAEKYALKILPVDLSVPPWAVAIVTLKNRTLSPVVARFIDHLREFAKSALAGTRSRRRKESHVSSPQPQEL